MSHVHAPAVRRSPHPRRPVVSQPRFRSVFSRASSALRSRPTRRALIPRRLLALRRLSTGIVESVHKQVYSVDVSLSLCLAVRSHLCMEGPKNTAPAATSGKLAAIR
jgi:hypothetical protein